MKRLSDVRKTCVGKRRKIVTRVIAWSKLSIPLYNGFDLHTKSPTFEQMVKEGVLFMLMSFKILL